MECTRKNRALASSHQPQDMQMIPPLGRKQRGTKEPLDEGEQVKSEKADLKLNIQKTKIMASDHITSGQIDGETMEIMTEFIFLGSKILGMMTVAMKSKDACSLEEKV